MDALYQTAGEVRAQVSEAKKLLLVIVTLFVAFLIQCNLPASYAPSHLVYGTVIEKSPNASQFQLSVRLPDGTVQNVTTHETRYAKTAVGEAWAVVMPDVGADKRTSVAYKLRVLALALTVLGGLAALVKLFRTLP